MTQNEANNEAMRLSYLDLTRKFFVRFNPVPFGKWTVQIRPLKGRDYWLNGKHYYALNRNEEYRELTGGQ